MEASILAALELWRTPESQKVVQIFVWLCSINAGFWVLARVMTAVADSWVGTAFTVFVVGGIIRGIARRGLREMFYHLSPFLWFICALKHPPIRVRRE